MKWIHLIEDDPDAYWVCPVVRNIFNSYIHAQHKQDNNFKKKMKNRRIGMAFQIINLSEIHILDTI